VRKSEIAAPPALPVHVIVPTAVYTVAQARAALGLRATTLPREIRAGRLRAARRGGRYYVLGSWLLQWVEAGEVKVRRRLSQCNARSGEPPASHPEATLTA
jgi:hypothetical protein